MVAAKAGSGSMIIVVVSGDDADSVRSICSQGNARPRRRRRSTIACDVGVGNLVSRFFPVLLLVVRRCADESRQALHRHVRELMRDFLSVSLALI